MASLLGLSLDEVPNTTGMEPHQWWEAWHKWFAERGLWMVRLPYKADVLGWPVGYSILDGVSPRNLEKEHSVVAFNGEPVHDPHPSRAGVVEAIRYTIIYPLDWAAQTGANLGHLKRET